MKHWVSASALGGVRLGSQKILDARFHPCELIALVLSLRPGPVDRVGGEARDDVPVAVVNRLTRGLADVDDHVKAQLTRWLP